MFSFNDFAVVTRILMCVLSSSSFFCCPTLVSSACVSNVFIVCTSINHTKHMPFSILILSQRFRFLLLEGSLYWLPSESVGFARWQPTAKQSSVHVEDFQITVFTVSSRNLRVARSESSCRRNDDKVSEVSFVARLASAIFFLYQRLSGIEISFFQF